MHFRSYVSIQSKKARKPIFLTIVVLFRVAREEIKKTVVLFWRNTPINRDRGRPSMRAYFAVKMDITIKTVTKNNIFYFTDNGIEFVFTIFLCINLVIMFLFVLEVRF